MIIDTEIFYDFYKENKEVFNYSFTYPINEDNFTKWINNHSDEYKPLASEFRAKTRHVSYTEFKGKLGQVTADIVSHIDKKGFDKIILLAYPNLEKSNFFISLYIFGLLYLNDTIKSILHIITDVEDMHIANSNDLIILADDASYTGNQFKSFFTSIPRDTKGTFFLAIPYISKQSYIRISSFFTYILEQSKDRVLFSEYCDKFEKFIEDFDSRYTDYLDINSSRYTIYFDHKLADSVSIYQLVYAMGEDGIRGVSKEPVTGDPHFKYENMSLIKDCPPIMESDITPFDIYQHKVCPPPFYKLYEYKHKGLTVKNIKELSDQEERKEYTQPPHFDYYSISNPISYLDLPPPPFFSFSSRNLSRNITKPPSLGNISTSSSKKQKERYQEKY
jgi:hypothetical protein